MDTFASMVPLLVYIVIVVVLFIWPLWRIFEKAGRPGWAAIVPIYGQYILLKVAGKSGWWVILWFIPYISIIPAVIVANGIAKKFGKSDWFAIGIFFLPFIFYPILGFGVAQYDPQNAIRMNLTYCPYCGTNIEANPFCSNCGKSVATTPAAS